LPPGSHWFQESNYHVPKDWICVTMSKRNPGTILCSSHTWKYLKPLPGVFWSIPMAETNDFAIFVRSESQHHPAKHQKEQQFMNLYSSRQIHTKV
jgi:hypothetical protein